MFNRKKINALEKRIERLETESTWSVGSDIRTPLRGILMDLVEKLGYKVGSYPTYIEESDCYLSTGKLIEKILDKLNLEIKEIKPTKQGFQLIKKK